MTSLPSPENAFGLRLGACPKLETYAPLGKATPLLKGASEVAGQCAFGANQTAVKPIVASDHDEVSDDGPPCGGKRRRRNIYLLTEFSYAYAGARASAIATTP